MLELLILSTQFLVFINLLQATRFLQQGRKCILLVKMRYVYTGEKNLLLRVLFRIPGAKLFLEV